MADEEKKGVQMSCSFCGKKQEEVALLIASEKANICSERVLLSVGVIFENLSETQKQVNIIMRSIKNIKGIAEDSNLETTGFPEKFKELIREIIKIGG